MKKIYYLSQYFDISSDKSPGGVLIRKRQIELFRHFGYQVILVMPDKSMQNIHIDNEVIKIPYFHHKKICDILERTGIWPDKDFNFSLRAYNYLKDFIKKEDLVFCVTGGSLETIILGSKLANLKNCKFIINYQDPVNFTSVNRRYVDNSFRLKRDHFEKKYIKNVDLIFTSSEINRLNLLKKYSFLKPDKVINNYFGYIKNIGCEPIKSDIKHPISIMYSGAYGIHQSPELIAKSFLGIEHLKLYFIGDYIKYKPILKYLNFYSFHEFMPHNEFLVWVKANISVGVVILTNEYLAACVPSKIYEYINLNIPIIGYLPDGDAKDIVNNNGFGRIFHFNDETGFINFLKTELNDSFIIKCKQNLALHKNNWSMDQRFREIIFGIESLN